VPPAASAPAAKTVSIDSPIVGTFYEAPAPDAKPFVKAGDEVNEDTVVCIVEAMKVMNEIKAEKRGRVRKVLVENAQPWSSASRCSNWIPSDAGRDTGCRHGCGIPGTSVVAIWRLRGKRRFLVMIHSSTYAGTTSPGKPREVLHESQGLAPAWPG